MMIDIQCNQCGKRFGTAIHLDRCEGVTITNCVKCHSPINISNDIQAIKEFHELLKTRPTFGNVCRQQRIAARLSLAQAAIRLGIKQGELERYEKSINQIPSHITERMIGVYDLEINQS